MTESSSASSNRIFDLEAQLRQEEVSHNALYDDYADTIEQLQAQLSQEREARSIEVEEGMESHETAVTDINLTWSAACDALQAQVAQLQTTVGEMRGALNLCHPFVSFKLQDVICAALGRDSACPAPAKENP